jgi:hypothetical protein
MSWNGRDGNTSGPQEGDTWSPENGNYDWSLGYGRSVNPGSVFSNGQWVSPLTYQANTLAAKKLGFETDNLASQNQILQGQIANQQIQNQVAGSAGGRLNQLLSNPSSIEQDPGYQFQYNQGLNAVNRTAAAKGMLGSGNRLYDLLNYGQDRAKTSYNDRIGQLGSLLSNTSQSSFQQNQDGKNNQYQTQPGGGVSLSGRY